MTEKLENSYLWGETLDVILNILDDEALEDEFNCEIDEDFNKVSIS